MTPPMELQNPKLFINRELSWLAFNDRVLLETKNASLPIYERLKFFSIVSSNLDEFFMVRVAGLKQQILGNVAETAADGLLPGEQLSAISDRSHAMVAEQYRTWKEELLPLLAEHQVFVLGYDALSAEQRAAAKVHFTASIFPALTPLAVDPGHPFPHLRNKTLNLAVFLRREGRRKRKTEQRENLVAVVQVPSVLKRLVKVPSATGNAYLWLEQLIAAHVVELFPGFSVVHSAAFRVTRNWDINVDEEESEDLLSSIQEELRRRDRGAAVRLEIDAAASKEAEEVLVSALKLTPADVYRIDGPLHGQDLGSLGELDPRPELHAEAFTPVTPPVFRDAESILSVISTRDVLLHHPYESFDPVTRFMEEAAEDPNVLAIKQTLYRTSLDSPVARALERAVENGKQVAVLVELKARLDEANNIAWARRMEESGVHVVYGLMGLKTHCKVALVVRKEGNGIRRYVHLGTGNYNPITARQYTDLSLFTTQEAVADDVTALFNMLTGYSTVPHWKKLTVAPLNLQNKIVALIERETERAASGHGGRILAKMNSLVDPTVIRALYRASQAGVEIDLLVRGICCLRPGMEGVSDRIRVYSVVDRYLEHSRVFAFGSGPQMEVFASSADWMPRNFFRRVEVMFPVEDPALKARLVDEVLGVGLRDNVKARQLGVDGNYLPVSREGPPFRSQQVLMELARRVSGEKTLQPIRHAAAPEVKPSEATLRQGTPPATQR